jgi:hypothetical protein
MTEENQNTEVPPAAHDYTAEARAQGWAPKEEFRGNEADWIEAEVFVQRGKEINPILRKNNERIQNELNATKAQLEQLRVATEEFKAFQKDAFEKKLAKYDEELIDLRELKKRALSENDGSMVIEIEDRMESVKADKAKEATNAPKPYVPPANTSVDPDVEAWEERNSWYKTDLKMASAANAIAAEVKKSNPYVNGKAFLDLVDTELAATFTPERLGKKVRPRNPVEGSSAGGSQSSGGKDYENLPPEAKAACDKFVKQKIMSRAEYVKMYDFS